jgi:hypothetical protein
MTQTLTTSGHVAFALAVTALIAIGAPGAAGLAPVDEDRRAMLDAQRAFYNAHYVDAAAQALALRTRLPDDLAAYELRSSALLFQLKRLIDPNPDRDDALRKCVTCAELMSDFTRENTRGMSLARARLSADDEDDSARFFLSKLDLNYVWLQLGSLGRRTGWNEYWEGRKGLDAVIKRNPRHIRARIARAWIDYIVDTKMPRGTKWILGGGSKKHALDVVREVAAADAEFFERVEAVFALWEMESRENNVPEAVTAARTLARDFPENREIAAFIEAKGKP